MTYTNAQAIFEEVITDMRAKGYPISSNIKKNLKFNGRLSSTWARCHRSMNQFTIEVSAKLITKGTKEDGFREVIIHELLHTIAGCFNHGPLFKSYDTRVNRDYGVRVARTTSSTKLFEETAVVSSKYIIKCTCCGTVWHKDRVSNVVRYPERYSCGKCRGKLVRVK